MSVLRRSRLNGEALPSTEQWNHEREVIQPLTVALRASVPGMSATEFPCQLATVPLNCTAVGAKTVIDLPPSLHLSADVKRLIIDIVCARLGLDDPAVSWRERGQWPSVSFTIMPRVPRSVTFTQVRDLIEQCDGSNPLVALGAGGVEIRLAMDGTEPHTALSYSTGRGKSSTLSGIIAQGLRSGWDDVTIVDPKYVSLNCFRGVPGVTINRTWDEQWSAITEFRTVMDERYRILNANPDAEFGRRVLVIDEGNSFAEEMRLHYATIKESGMPTIPPVLTDLAFAIFKGRQVNCNIIGAWQRLSVRAVGGSGDVRDQFGLKILCGHSAAAMLSLTGERGPRGSRHPGRAVVARGDTLEPCQLVYWRPNEAREWALNGRQPEPPRIEYPAVSYSGAGDTLPPLASECHTGEASPVTLVDAVRLGLVDCTLAAARAARARDERFPESRARAGREYVYDPDELAEWSRNRRTNDGVNVS